MRFERRRRKANPKAMPEMGRLTKITKLPPEIKRD
jgi:hypothetical protein